MDSTGAKSSSPPIDRYCLLCRAKLKSFNQLTSLSSTENFEVLQDIFQVFSKYMGWDPPPEYKYNFQKDQFPFCGGCSVILIRIYKIHEDIQSLEMQIEQFVLSATAKILDSERKILTSSTKEGDRCSADLDIKEAARSCDSLRLDGREICHYYRGSISKRYSARVQLTIEDRSQLENYERVVKLKTPEVSGDLDEDDAHEGFMSSPDGSVPNSEDDPTYLQEPEANANNYEIQTAQDSASSCDSTEEDNAEETDNVPEQQVPKSKHFSTRVKELSPNEYLFDDKLTFVYKPPLWKCSSCNMTTLERNILIRHIKSIRCSGLVHPNSAKELQHRGFKYDKLDDGRFECRRCPFTTTSKTSVKKHIDTSHSLARKRKKTQLITQLVKSASLTQLRPDVYLVNKEHEVEFKNKKFYCSACSFRTGLRKTVIRHVIEKHNGKYRKKEQMMAMSIQPDGPDKYKIGDFPFEASTSEFKCTTCGHACALLRHMKIHIRSEHVKDMFKNVCDICGFATFDKDIFNGHMRVHKDERPFLCPTCGKSFKKLQNLRNHEAEVHPTSPVVKSHLCEVCGQKSKSKYLLGIHMKSHVNVACEICGKTYSAIYLPKHRQSHNAEKMFECKQCGSKFQSKMSLYTHRKSCSGDKPYSCDLCGMKFTQHFSVTRHKNVAHNPEKTTKTCLRKGPAKQRRGQSLLTKKSSAASGNKDSGRNKPDDNENDTAANAAPEATSSNIAKTGSL